MIFGNAAWGLRETPLEKQFKITAEMGLLELEIGIANAPGDVPLNVSKKELEDIREMSAQNGVNITCAATGNDFTTGTEDIEKVKKVIDISSALGVRYLRIFAGFTALEKVEGKLFDRMINALAEVSFYAEKRSVVPVIETHGGVCAYNDGVEHFMSPTTDLETVKRIIESLPENVMICYDPANLYAVGIKNPERFYEEIKDRVAYAHFKDFKMLSSGHLKPSYCGASSMDWKAILTAMKDFDGICFFEYENTDDIEEGLKSSYRYIAERMKEV